MNLNRNHFIDPPKREALISLTALYFIEEHGLLPPDKIEDAKRSLQALFLRASGEETMLRKLIDMLKITRNIHLSFANIAGILGGVSKCLATTEARLAALRQHFSNPPVSAEENSDFVGPLLSFSQAFIHKIGGFYRHLLKFLDLKEAEAQATSFYRIAKDARERLKRRLAGDLGAQPAGADETRIKDELVASFDYGETESRHKSAMREARAMEREIRDQLKDIQAMCRMAMNPGMRDPNRATSNEYEDVFALFSDALMRYPRLQPLQAEILDLFKLYQHAYGTFMLDYSKLKDAMRTMMDNTDAYFDAKGEDRDIAIKREKLRKIEGLIPFLEHGVRLSTDAAADTYFKFSRQYSEVITAKKTLWLHISEDLLRAKVQAEAELSTRL